MKKLNSGELDFAVATVDSFILNGAVENFPGTIIMVIDESKGGDAFISRKDRLMKIEELKTKKNFKIAFTPGSPSDHLLKSISSHFDVATLRDKKGAWRVEVNGSEDARKKLESGEVDAAVMWEPDVSRALTDQKLHKLLGTEDTRKLIVDILIVNREFAKNSPEKVKTVLSHYFKTLKSFRDQPETLLEEIQSATKLNEQQSAALQKGVRWINLTENARDWFGINFAGKSSEGLVNTIESTIEILMDHNDFTKNPLPDQDPYRLQYSSFVEQLVSDTSQFGVATADGDSTNTGDRTFSPLTPEQWDVLTEIATLKVRPITFQSGTAELSDAGKEEIDLAAASLIHYPNFRILIKGHSGLRGDSEANKKLSLDRADTVRTYLISKHSTDVNRVKTLGMGASRPLPRDPGEADRSYEYRLPRVELALTSEVL
jgi:outer membrane protein OmpA-like peptidoglycan-associated protein